MEVPHAFENACKRSGQKRKFQGCHGYFTRQLLDAREVLSAEDLQKLIGWTLLDHDDSGVEDGDPVTYLQLCIRDARIHGRCEGVGYLSEKSIAKYLARASTLLSKIQVLDAAVKESIYPKRATA